MKVHQRMENLKQQRTQIVVLDAEYSLGNLEKTILVDWLCVEEKTNFSTFGTTWCFKREKELLIKLITVTWVKRKTDWHDLTYGWGEGAENMFRQLNLNVKILQMKNIRKHFVKNTTKVCQFNKNT